VILLLFAESQVRVAADNGRVGDVDCVVLVGADDLEITFHVASVGYGIVAFAQPREE
jgi:hypothetical protein